MMSHRLTSRVILALAILGVTLGVMGVAAVAEPAPRTLFSRLSELDARQAVARQRAAQLEGALDEHDARIRATIDELDVTRRATQKLQRDLILDQIAWERAHRARERGAHSWAPGEREDLAHLLRVAAPRARARRSEDLRLVAALDAGETRVEELVSRHGAMIVELAQQKGREDAAEASRAEQLERARGADPDTIDADLARTQQELEQEIALMLKNPSTRDFHRLKGTLIPPVRQDPTHTYGPRKQRDSSSWVRHTGLTYAIDAGEQVRAVADGLVVHAAIFEGFGRMVIIDHGGGYHSVYAHLGDATVRAGDRVKRSHVLGTSGESGSLEGPKLYFELRHEGKPIDPRPWFIRVR